MPNPRDDRDLAVEREPVADTGQVQAAATDGHPRRGEGDVGRLGLCDRRGGAHEKLREVGRTDQRQVTGTVFGRRHGTRTNVGSGPLDGTSLRHGFRGL